MAGDLAVSLSCNADERKSALIDNPTVRVSSIPHAGPGVDQCERAWGGQHAEAVGSCGRCVFQRDLSCFFLLRNHSLFARLHLSLNLPSPLFLFTKSSVLCLKLRSRGGPHVVCDGGGGGNQCEARTRR